ncbi:MAG TPA: flagellar basal-body protein FlbY [Asticcacaulis sp.]|nr:flagellar basal-body protein FlbY [Asticcacaulis sp.]
MALTAHSGSERARQMLALTLRLAERLERETQSLEAHRPQDIAAEVEETRSLSNLYRRESLRIKTDPSLLDGMTPDEQRQLREATVIFQTRLRRYEHAVNAARLVTEGILSAVARDLGKAKSSASTYGARGKTLDNGPQSFNFGGRA